MYMEWRNEFGVGVESFNSEHKMILDKINEMHEEFLGKNRKDKQTALIDSLVKVSVAHFKHEEEELEKRGYESLLAHQDEHSNLLIEIENLKEEYRLGKVEMDLEFIGFLSNWFLIHTTEVDSDYKPLFKN